jgi:hypothetical protein
MFVRRCLLLGAALVASLSVAQLAEARIVRRAEAEPASLTKKTSDCAKPEPSCCAPQPKCCAEPCIKYHHRGPKLCCGNCSAPKEIVLKVKNPCTGCETEVPVCTPACCEGEPKVCEGTGFLGRDIVEYEWCCGFYVRVAFTHCGDIVVTTWGR